MINSSKLNSISNILISLFVSIIIVAYIKFIYILLFEDWSIYTSYILFSVLFLVLFNKLSINLEAEDNRLYIAILIIATTIIFTPLSSEDLLYYYLPFAEHINIYKTFQENILPSHLEAPLAYPPIEYFILSILYDFMPSEITIKLFQIIKISIFLILFIELIHNKKNKEILLGFLFIPFFLTNSIYGYYQDLNMLLFIVVFLLSIKNNNFRFLLFIFLSYALLSKYTNLIAYVIFMVFILYSQGKKKITFYLLPACLLIPLFIKNFYFYDNPIFPIAYNILNQNNDVIIVNFLNMLVGKTYNYEFFFNIFTTIVSSYIIYFAFKVKKLRIEHILVFTFMIIWVFSMNTNWSGATIRFIYPIILLGFIFTDLKYRDIFFLLGFNIAYMLIDRSIPILFFGGISSMYFLVVLINKNEKYLNYLSVLIIFLVILLPFRAYYKTFSLTTSGYEYAKNGYNKHLDFLENHNNVVTDLWVIPYMLRIENNISISDSYQFYSIYKEKNFSKVDYLYVSDDFFEQYPNTKQYFTFKSEVNNKKLFERNK